MRWRRPLILVPLALLGSLVLGVVLLHLPWTRARVLDAALGRIAPDGSLSVERLDYNLLRLRFELHGVALRTPGIDPPYFSAARVAVRLPWRQPGSALALREVEIDHPQLLVSVDANGISNFQGEGTRIERAIRIGQLTVVGFGARFQDATRGLSVDSGTIDLTMAGAERAQGTPEQRRAASLRIGERETRARLDGGTVGWNGIDAFLGNLGLRSEPLDVHLDGEVTEALADREIDLDWQAELRLDPLSTLAGLAPPAAGEVTASGTLSGDARGLRARAEIAAPSVAARGFRAEDVRLRFRLAEALELDEASALIEGATLRASGRIALDPEGSSRLDLRGESMRLARLAALAGRDPLPVAGRLDATLTAAWLGPRPQPEALQATAEILATEPVSAPAGVTLGGRADLTVEEGGWRLVSDLRVGGLDGFGLEQTRVRTRLRGPLDALRAEGTVAAEGSPLDTGIPARATATLRLTEAGLSVGDLVLSHGSVEARGSLELAADGTVDAILEGRDLPGNELVSMAPAGLLPDGLILDAGTLEVSARARGAVRNPTLEARMALRAARLRSDLVLSASGIATLAADGTMAGRELILDLGDARITGALEVATDGALRGTLASQGVGLVPLVAAAPAEMIPAAARPVDGIVAFDLQLAGSLASPSLGGHIEARGLALPGSAAVDVRALLDSDGNTTRLSELTLDADGATVRASGIVTPGAGRADLVALLEIADLAATSGRPELEGIGRLTADVGLKVDRGARLVGVDVWELEADLFGTEVRSVDAGWLQWDGDGVEIDRIELRAGSTRLSAAGRLGVAEAHEGIEVAIVGNVADLAEIARQVGGARFGPSPLMPQELAGALEIDLRVDGTIAAPEPSGRAEVRDGRIRFDGLPAVDALSIEVDVDRTMVALRGLSARLAGARLAAQGRLPLALLPLPEGIALGQDDSVARLHATATEVDQRLFQPWLTGEQLDRLSVAAEVALEIEAPRLELAALRGEIRAARLQFAVDGLGIEQSLPTRLQIADGKLRVAAWDWRRTNGPSTREALTVTGEVGLSADPEIDLELTADIGLAALTPFLPRGAIDGRTRAQLSLGGSARAPRPVGRIEVEDLAYRLASPRLAIDRLSGTVDIADGRLRSDGLRGTANGGDLLVFVDLDVANPAAPSGTVGITGRALALESAGARASANVDLTLSARPDGDLRAFGAVTILEGGYRSRRTLAGELQRALGATAVRPAVGEPSMLDRVRLDIRVTASDQLIMDTPFAELAATMDLQVVGTATRPGLVGRAEVVEGGRVLFGGTAYSVDRAVIEFADPARIAPRIDLIANTRISRYDVRIGLEGDAFAPLVTVSSDPPLNEGSVLSLMATGRTLEDAGGQSNQILREQAFAVLSGQLGGVTRALGIDSVRLERAQQLGNDPFERPDEADLFPRTSDLAARVTFGRRFGSLFDLTFSQNLEAAGEQSWVGTLYLPRGLSLRAGTYDDGESRSVELRQEFVFGGAPRTARRTPPRVSAIELEGTLILPAERLREVLTLAPGERFDFLAWQRDQDRLRELYREADRLEARVRARRRLPEGAEPSDASSVTLVYEVEPGPRTELTVSGHTFDDDTIATMRRAWSESLATDFLIGDLVALAREALARRGYVEAEASAQIVSREPVKTVEIRVEPGRRSRAKRVVFSGNRSLSAGELRRRLRAEGLRDSIWFDPLPARAALVALYRERGYLDARIAMAPPASAEGRAELHVDIAEGARFTVGDVEFVGNDRVAAATLRAAAGVEAGAPYVPAEIDEAASAVVGRYLDEGFNDASISWTPSADPQAAAVHLRFSVSEGPRHVLESIDIRGRRRTRLGVIDRAVQLVRGDTAGLREVERLRRRLYQTGAFSSVSVSIDPVGPPAEGRQPVRLRIELVEVASFRLRYGVQLLDERIGAETRETTPGLSAILTHRNLLGVGGSVSVLGRARKDELFSRASISFPRLLSLPIRTTVIAQQSRRTIEQPGQFRIDRVQSVAQLQQIVELGRGLSVGYAYNFERTTTEIPDLGFKRPPAHVSRLIPTLVWDTRDDRLAPRRGFFHSSTLELGLAALGSDFLFRKYSAQQHLFVPLGPFTLATAVRFGAGLSLDEATDTLPEFERFFAGGATTVRGYPEDSLGRTPFFGSFLPGGDALLVLNQEVRFPIRGWVHGVVFADAGSTFTALDRVRLSGLKASIGPGLRLVTPYLTLRLDYGIRLHDVDGFTDLPRGRLHFGIGHIF